LVLVGSRGETAEAVSRSISELGLNHKIFCFYQMPLEELAAVYRLSFGFIYPSMAEGFGLPLLEAMYSGLPLVHSDIEVFNELAGESSVRFKPDDPTSMAGALKLLDKAVVKAEGPSEMLTEDSIFNSWKSVFKELNLLVD
jgi:glycosyltransferase involved in cell wall biosynthesis